MLCNGRRQPALAGLWVAQCVAIAAMEMSGPFWPLYLRDHVGLTGDALLLWSSALVAAPMVAAVVTARFWGRCGDRYGHKLMVLRALLALSATQWLIALQDAPALILVLRLLQGGLAGVIAAAMAYGLSISASDQRRATLGLLQSATAAGTLLGPLLGGLISDIWSYARIFQLAAVLCLVMALAMLVLLTDAPVHAQPAAEAGSHRRSETALPARLLKVVLLALLLAQAARMMPQSFFALFIEAQAQGSNLLIGITYGASGLAMLMSAPGWGRYFDRLGTRQQVSRLALVAFFSTLLMLMHLRQPGLWELLLLRFAWGICLAAMMPALFGLLGGSGLRVGQRVGSGQAAAKLGNFTGYLLGGLVAAWFSLTQAFIGVALMYLLLGLWLLYLYQSLSLRPATKETCHAEPLR